MGDNQAKTQYEKGCRVGGGGVVSITRIIGCDMAAAERRVTCRCALKQEIYLMISLLLKAKGSTL